MYLEHFGLERPPFKITPDTQLFYEGSQRGAILEALVYAIESGEGIIKVVGEVGAGKTMLCRMLEERMSDSTQLVYIANPSLSPENILHVIAFELALDVSPENDKLVVMQKLQQYLLEQHRNNRQVVVLVEEAQSMPLETLEEIRLLSNLETHESKLLQIVLFGQPELDENLSIPSIRQLRERIAHAFSLTPFASNDIVDYLNFRMRAVGYRGPDIFDTKTAKVIAKASAGLTRRINILADKTLLAAFAQGTHQVQPKHVKTAIADCEFGRRPTTGSHHKTTASIAAAISIVTLCIGYFGLQWQQKQLEASQTPTIALPAAQPDTSERIAEASETPQVSAPEKAQPKQAVSVAQAAQNNSNTPTKFVRHLNQTQNWLPHTRNEHFTIQLMIGEITHQQEIAHLIANLPPSMESSKIYVYPFIQNGEEKYSLIYDEFASWQLAKETLEALPDNVKANKPYIRPIRGIRNEIDLYQAQHPSNAG